jgi:hypothetical protein
MTENKRPVQITYVRPEDIKQTGEYKKAQEDIAEGRVFLDLTQELENWSWYN